MKKFQLLIQTLWLGFLVYFMLERNAIKAALGDKFIWAVGLIVAITVVMFVVNRKK